MAKTRSFFSRVRKVETIDRFVSELQRNGLIMQRAGSGDGAEWIVDGSPLRNFGSCSYMGLERHPDLLAGAAAALREFGSNFSISRAYLQCPLYDGARSTLSDMHHGPPRARRAVDDAGASGRAAGPRRRPRPRADRSVRARQHAHGDRLDRRRADRAACATTGSTSLEQKAARGGRRVRARLVPVRRRLLDARRLRAVRGPRGAAAALTRGCTCTSTTRTR